MGTIIKDHADPPELVLRVLTQHLPYSLPTLRRIEFMKTAGGGKTSDSHVLSTFDTEAPGKDFLVAILDFSKGPDTEMWLYSSLENPMVVSDRSVCEEQVLELLSRVGELECAYEAQRATPSLFLIGSLHKKILEFLEKRSLVKYKSPEHTKFLFKLQDLPPAKELPAGFSWSTVRPSDIPLVLSRTSIPYQGLTSLLIPRLGR